MCWGCYTLVIYMFWRSTLTGTVLTVIGGLAWVFSASAASVGVTPIYLFYPSSYSVARGQQVTLTGRGFGLKGNVLHFDDVHQIDKLPSPDKSTLSFTIPNNLPLKNYEIWVTNTSRKSKNTKPLVVKNPRMADPVISSISPRSGPYGTQVTITGSGFTKTGNDIYGTYDIIRNATSSDGKTISIQILPSPNTPQSKIVGNSGSKARAVFVPIYFHVINANGISAVGAPGIFQLKL